MKCLIYFIFLFLLLSTASAASLNVTTSSDIIINCDPDCSCASDTCIGATCADGCGGTCPGVKSCGGGSSGGSSGGTNIKFQCNDRIDNDGDGLIDFPNDPDCFGYYDDNESSEIVEIIEEPTIKEPVEEEPNVEEAEEPTVEEPTEEQTTEEQTVIPKEGYDYSKLLTKKYIAYWVLILLALVLILLLVPWKKKKKKPKKEKKRKPKKEPRITAEALRKKTYRPKETYTDSEIEEFKKRIGEANIGFKQIQNMSAKEYLDIIKLKETLSKDMLAIGSLYATLPKGEIIKKEERRGRPRKIKTEESKTEETKMIGAPSGRCMKCKEQVDIVNPVEKEFGQVKGITGTCPKCGTKVFKMLGKIKKK